MKSTTSPGPSQVHDEAYHIRMGGRYQPEPVPANPAGAQQMALPFLH